MNFVAGKIPLVCNSPQKCIHSVPAQEKVKTSYKVLLTSVERRRCSNEAKMRNWLKFPGVPQTSEPISAVSGPKFTTLRGHVEKVLLLNKFFFRLSIRAKIQPNKVVRWCPDGDLASFFRPVFPPSRVPHFSDLHPKLALRPHHAWKYGRHPTFECPS